MKFVQYFLKHKVNQKVDCWLHHHLFVVKVPIVVLELKY